MPSPETSGTDSPNLPRKRRRRLLAGVIFVAVLLASIGLWRTKAVHRLLGLQTDLTLREIPVDGERAFEFLEAICEIGPRVSGTEGMQRQQQMLSAHFRAQGGQVEFQHFETRHPDSGAVVSMANMIIEWNPEAEERILLCAHYDTRPYPDRDPDPRLRRGQFIGANDGASGTALLCELAYHMQALDCEYGVDFVLFDAEEHIFQAGRDDGRYFLGSKYFSEQYIASPPGHTYRYAVLFDMIGDAYLNIYKERISSNWPDTAPLYNDIWRVARELGVREFIPRQRYEVRDDHIALHDIAGIPACDLIDFHYQAPRVGYSYWHTTHDTPDKCSPLSLAKVGWVALEWLRQVD